MHILDIRIRNMIIAVLAVLALFLLVKSVGAIKEIADKSDAYPAATISVRGTGEAIGTPDVATFNFTVREKSEDVASAQKLMSEKANKAIDYLKQQGVEVKDIKTESYYTNPMYDYVQEASTEMMYPVYPSKQVLTGYEVSETVSVKVRDIKKAGEFLTAIAKLKIGEVSSLSFTIDDKEALKAEAKKMAIEKARKDAEHIAKSLNVDLKGVVGFYEETPYEGGMYEANMMNVKVMDGGATPNLETGEQKVTVNVSVTYEIKD